MTGRCKVVSLFSGAGGFDWGFHLTGNYDTHFANELKPTPALTLAHNFGLREVKPNETTKLNGDRLVVQGDIAEIEFESMNVNPDILIGGPPCQDFSIVKGGRNQGTQVKRGRLYAHFVRAVAHLQPKVFVFENVPGLVSHSQGQPYKTILQDFQNLTVRWNEIRETTGIDNGNKSKEKFGYEIVFSEVVSSQRLGVPQTRRRVIVIGLRQDLANEIGIFHLQSIRDTLRNALTGVNSPLAKFPLTVMEIFEGQPLTELGGKYKDVMLEYDGVWQLLSTPQAELWKREVWDSLTFNVVDDYLKINNIQRKNGTEFEEAMIEHERIIRQFGFLGKPVSDQILVDDTNSIGIESQGIRERMSRIPPGKNHEFLSETPWFVNGRGMSLIYRRPFPLKPAPTVVAYGGGGTWGYHYERKRGKLTNRERARIQTFTDDFSFIGKESEVRAQIGEAVPPLLSFRIGEAIYSLLLKR